MPQPETAQDSRLIELRRSFDEAFQRPPPTQAAQPFRALAIRVRADAFAISAAQIAGVLAAARTVPVPAALPGLVGLAGVRGSLVPVYRLGSFLGYSQPEETERWLALVDHRGARVGLAFDALEGYVEVAASAVAQASGNARQRHVEQVLRHGEVVRAMIDIDSVLQEIRDHVANAMQERSQR